MSGIKRAILQRLSTGYASTADLARVAAITRFDVQQLLRELARDGLVDHERALTPLGRKAIA